MTDIAPRKAVVKLRQGMAGTFTAALPFCIKEIKGMPQVSYSEASEIIHKIQTTVLDSLHFEPREFEVTDHELRVCMQVCKTALERLDAKPYNQDGLMQDVYDAIKHTWQEIGLIYHEKFAKAEMLDNIISKF